MKQVLIFFGLFIMLAVDFGCYYGLGYLAADNLIVEDNPTYTDKDLCEACVEDRLASINTNYAEIYKYRASKFKKQEIRSDLNSVEVAIDRPIAVNYFALHFALICTIISAVALLILIIMASCGEELLVATPCIYLVTMLLDIPVYLICKIKNNHQEQKLRHKDRIIGTFNKFINFKEQ